MWGKKKVRGFTLRRFQLSGRIHGDAGGIEEKSEFSA